MIYFNATKYHTSKNRNGIMVCVDGLQRITAITDFMENRIKAFGYFYNQYEDGLPILKCTIRLNIATLESKGDILKWYVALNSGVAHTNEEINRVKELIKKEERKMPTTT